MIKSYNLIKRSLICAALFLCFTEAFSMDIEREPYNLRSGSKKKHLEPKMKKDEKIKLDHNKYNLEEPKQYTDMEEDVTWPASVANNEGWQQGAERAANSWGMSIAKYLSDAQAFLQDYKVNYRKSRSLEDLIPLEKAINDQSEKPKFAFKERQR